MKRHRPSAAFIPPGSLSGVFLRTEGPVPLAVVKRLQTGYPKRGKFRVEQYAPIFIGCGAGVYIAMTIHDIFPTIQAKVDPAAPPPVGRA